MRDRSGAERYRRSTRARPSSKDEGHTEVLFSYLRFGPTTGQPLPEAGHPLLRTVLYSPRGVQVFAQIRRMGYLVEETPDGLKLTYQHP